MGKRNKERRAAKQRTRQASGQRSSRPEDGCTCGQCGGAFLTSAEAIGMTLVAAAQAAAAAAGEPGVARACAHELAGPSSPLPARTVHQAAGEQLTRLLTALWQHGWQPRDVHQVTRRRLGATHVGLAVAALADEAARYASPTVDPQWLDQLGELGAEVRRAPEVPVLIAWARRAGKDDVEAVTVTLELLGVWLTLPGLERLLPVPGSARPGRPSAGVRSEDQRALARVRALLAKAEATDFPEEAEALSAKAQQLMARHSLERLVAEASTDDREPASARRLWLDAPYADAKALLVTEVAEANRCRTVWAAELGFVTVIGDARDLTATELMVTSLLVQATRAMVDRGKQDAASAQSRSRSFRQSFLVAYATRIGERLQGATAAATQEVGGASLLPVLAADLERVEQAREALFPRTVQRSVAVSSYQGYAAGRAAADQARLDTQLALREQDRAAS